MHVMRVVNRWQNSFKNYDIEVIFDSDIFYFITASNLSQQF